MKIMVLLVSLLTLISCSTERNAGLATVSSDQQPVSAMDATSTIAPYTLPRSGAQVAEDLTAQYYDKAVDCGGPSRAAFLCSGVDVRGTGSGNGYDTWNPSETAVKVGGVSFTFFRTDYKVQRLAKNFTHGFIFYPMMKRPSGKISVEIMCFFPIDGGSDNRPENGCGATPGKPMSDMCHRVGVETGAQWSAHYNKYGEHGANGRGGCAMDTRKASNDHAGPNFYQGLIGGRDIAPKTFEKPNDLKHRVWDQDIASQLPIQAFFYINAAGLVLAKNDQRRFCEVTGQFMPIIQMTLPKTLQQEMSFRFNSADQLSVCGGDAR